ncbi:MAG TPA: metallophosphoesterase, partial [Sphingomicrobium sp.]|nr:metallophosphoesterase [Sphingomicrobium sp.]
SKTLLVFLGDLIDRGPDSRGVIERLRSYRPARTKVIPIAGNHEEVLLRLLAGESEFLGSWLRFGGAEFLQSYSCDPHRMAALGPSDAIALLRKTVPETHIRFLSGFVDTLRFGDYLFVHAGIRPGVDLAMQSQSDLRWIRSPFLEEEAGHGFVVVHGHTISNEVEWRTNRIGIDTGAYRTGVLTALGLQGEKCWTLQTEHQRNETVAH